MPFKQEISQQRYLQAIDACTSGTACLVSLRNTAPSWMNKGKRPALYHIMSLQPPYDVVAAFWLPSLSLTPISSNQLQVRDGDDDVFYQYTNHRPWLIELLGFWPAAAEGLPCGPWLLPGWHPTCGADDDLLSPPSSIVISAALLGWCRWEDSEGLRQQNRALPALLLYRCCSFRTQNLILVWPRFSSYLPLPLFSPSSFHHVLQLENLPLWPISYCPDQHSVGYVHDLYQPWITDGKAESLVPVDSRYQLRSFQLYL